MTKHTPGPWVSDELANGRLIAAPPELLEACKAAVGRLEAIRPYNPVFLTDIKRAIAKAEGTKENQ